MWIYFLFLILKISEIRKVIENFRKTGILYVGKLGMDYTSTHFLISFLGLFLTFNLFLRILWHIVLPTFL